MTHERIAPGEQQAIDAAINRVLASEVSSRDAVDACRREGERIIADAEVAAAAVGSRLEERVSAAHALADRGIERALGALGEPSPLDDRPRMEPSAQRIDAVVRRLTVELTEIPTGGGGV